MTVKIVITGPPAHVLPTLRMIIFGVVTIVLALAVAIGIVWALATRLAS